MKCLNIKILCIYGIILATVHVPTLQGSRRCDSLEEKLNLSDTEKDKFNLNQCGGIHGIHALSQITGDRKAVRVSQITQVISLLPCIKSHIHTYACIFLLRSSKFVM